MEDLIAQFGFLSNQALQDKSFDPATIEDLMKLFEIEAYKSWAAVELEQQQEVEAAEVAMQEKLRTTWTQLWRVPWMSSDVLKRKWKPCPKLSTTA
ncbi:uncharacterized protein Pyn_38500 [Prunus yedoensis var. nudiflora]|uniref:Uncharacterized protein n=1 Tax=Prunus yedoensis var. nudiflora TaxID=2094558 RepID=A0A314YRN1_PRUYE|nr:uncharacterized protein Pyn_38500 [Prunus yedoensis var. nudiflora]